MYVTMVDETPYYAKTYFLIPYEHVTKGDW